MTAPLWLAVPALVFAAIGVTVVAWVAVHLPGWWRDLAAEDREVALTRRTADLEAAIELPPGQQLPPDLTLFASGRAR